MNPTTARALAFTLIQFLWQGAAIALAAGILVAILGRFRSHVRYAVLCAALALMVLAPVVTFVIAIGSLSERSTTVAAAPTPLTSPLPQATAVPPVGRAQSSWVPWVLGFWMAGVVGLAVRALVGWCIAQRLVRWNNAPAAEFFQESAVRLRASLGINRSVRILSSAVAAVPATVGWLRPVVLLPAASLTGLTPQHLEFLLAHELAHVRRHDYLVNLAQTAIETVLFYQPGVWWVSRQIRIEREHCCDDLAVTACGDVVGYARTLVTLETVRTGPRDLAVAANGGSLVTRIRRLAHPGRPERAAPPAWMGALVPTALVLAALIGAAPPPHAGSTKPTPHEITPEAPSKSAGVEGGVERGGFLEGLASAGYVKISVDDVIALREHGVEPPFIKAMVVAGLGTPSVSQLITLREHGVEPEFIAALVRSGAVNDLNFETVVRLREHGVDGDDLGRIRAAGFGPYSTGEVIRLRESGVTADRIERLKPQGFVNLNLEQIIKLSRGGII
jgi:beta-lactamase regulating signal transducer with metallopeptidase domain